MVQPSAVATRRPQPLQTLRAQLAVLTAAKTVANTALRWVGPFLPTLERAFGTTTGTLTGIMGVAELGGLSTVWVGPKLDRGHERTVFTLGLVAVACSSAIALGGSVATFAVSFVLLVLGVGNLTIAGHAWIGHRVPFAARNRAIGSFETSWAVALLVGAPLVSILIRWFGWQGPYVALLIGSGIAAVFVWLLVAPGVAHPPTPTPAPAPTPAPTGRERLPWSAWPPMLASAATAATGLGVFIVSGVWLDDAHGVSTAGLGLVAAGFGAVELLSSSGVALFADRFGVKRSVIAGMLLLGCGLITMALSESSTALAITGLALFLTGFEYAFVSSLTMVTEAAPQARGRTIGISNMIGTLARSGAVVASGQLYEQFGMTGPMVMSAITATCAIVAASFTRLVPD